MRIRGKLMAMVVISLGAALSYTTAAGKFRSRPAVLPAPALVAAEEKAAPDKMDRTVLPIPEPKYPPITELDARNAKPPPRFEVKAPRGAPNVLIVLIDDMGFGQSSAFGGPIRMPTLDRLAKGGLKYNKFH